MGNKLDNDVQTYVARIRRSGASGGPPPARAGKALAGLACTVLTLAAAGAAGEAETPTDGFIAFPSDLAQAINAHERATFSNDVATLAGLVAHDYVLVNSDSSIQGKSSYLADFATPGFKLDPYVIEDSIDKVLGDAALTGGLVKVSWTLDGERHLRLLRIVHVWARRDGRWQLVYTQLTRVPK